MNQCEVCEIKKPKYKCPKCLIPYCSIACYRAHQANSKPEVENSLCDIVIANKSRTEHNVASLHIEHQQFQLIKTDYIEDQSLRLTEQQLQNIRRNPKIISMLRDKELRQKILKIDDSRMRLHALQSSMLEPGFMNFADEVLQSIKK